MVFLMQLGLFSKKLNELTLKELAFLAGLTAGPNLFSPFKNIELANQRCNNVLRKMNYCKFITNDEMNNALNLPLEIKSPQIVIVKMSTMG